MLEGGLSGRAAAGLTAEEAELRDVGKVPEVGIAGHELNVMIETGLGDQRVDEPRPPSPLQNPGPQQPGPRPVAFRDFQEGELPEQLLHRPRNLWIAQELGQNNRGEDCLPVTQGEAGRFDVRPFISLEVSDEGARIDGDQRRSCRSSLRSIENLTLPRRARRRSYASLAATNASPWRMVPVTPWPVRSWARRRRSLSM